MGESAAMKALVERWQKLRPVNLVTLEPIIEEEAWDAVSKSLAALESLGYVLLQRH